MSSLSSQDPFSSLQVGSSMRVEWLHLGWFCTHILRSVVDTDQTKQLIGSLASEVQTLQLELHRAHRLVDKYADTVEVAERTDSSSLDQHPLERRKDSLALRPARPSTLGRGRGRR